MRLKSFGCSFIFGSDLKDADPTNYTQYSKLTWPALLANHLGYSYECYAHPGSGNLQICERILDDLAINNEPTLYVIGWTWTERYDHRTSNNRLQPWNTIRPGATTLESEFYYKHLHTEYQDKLTTLMSIKIAVDRLNQKQYPFIMTYMDPLTFDQRWNVGPGMLDLQNYIKPLVTDFEGKTFLEWSRINGYVESAGWHPLEEAHQSAGDYMIKVFDKQKINGPTQ